MIVILKEKQKKITEQIVELETINTHNGVEIICTHENSDWRIACFSHNGHLLLYGGLKEELGFKLKNNCIKTKRGIL